MNNKRSYFDNHANHVNQSCLLDNIFIIENY